MTIRNLEHLFQAQSVALIGASERSGSLGRTVLRNLLDAKFAGGLMLVNPKHSKVRGIECYPTVEALPDRPDVGVICTPAHTVPGLVDALGKRGTKAAIVLTAGLNSTREGRGCTLKQEMLDAARPHLLRILGPNCVGLLVPGHNFNASFTHTNALPGKVAFVSQSGALVTAVLDWAKSRGIGFSKLVSLGDCADVDFGDVIDYLAGDEETHAILLYIESITAARKFMSAARAASRSKPVLAVKAGRAPEGARAAASHTGALAGSDDVYDAAIRRAGMLRVYSTEDLFDIIETLARSHPVRGSSLAIMTNGGGPGVMAADALVLSQGKLASLSAATMDKLDATLPLNWSRGNPVDIIGDAPVDRYVNTLKILLQEPQADAVLMIHAPTAIVSSTQIASAIAPIAKDTGRNVIGCWLGGDSAMQARRIFEQQNLATYDTPEEAVHAFMHLVAYRRNQEILMEVPPASSEESPQDHSEAVRVVHEAVGNGPRLLSAEEVEAVLSSYGISSVPTRIASSAAEAAQVAQEIGFPVALKIVSKDVTHKSDVGGVALDLQTAESVRAAADAMLTRVRAMKPDAVIQGFAVQAMVRLSQTHELIVGVSDDKVFGPVILFGQGGTSVEVVADRAIGLPPLNMTLARDLISRTRVAKLLAGYRNRPAANVDAICRTLCRLSELVTEIPEIVELDINPLLADDKRVVALDARIRVAPVDPGRGNRLVICPYPAELEESITWQGQRILLRPIKPEDGQRHVEFFKALDPADIRYRAFMAMRDLSPAQLSRLTQIDYDREMAFIATRERAPGQLETLGVARAIADPDIVRAEFAIIVRSDLKGQGLGSALLSKLINYARTRGIQELFGQALGDNQRLTRLVRKFGFEVHWSGDPGIVALRLSL